MLIMIKLCQNIQMDFNKSNDIIFTVTLVLPKMKYLKNTINSVEHFQA